MKRKLQTIANQLTESDIQELIRIKKMGDKKTVALRKKRDKLAANLARIDAQLEKMTGSPEEAKPARAKRGRKPKAAAAPAKKTATKRKKAAKPETQDAPAKRGAPRGKRSAGTSLSATVRQIFADAGTPLKASQVVDSLPGAGIKVKSIPDMRKRISVVLASQKNHFQQVERGLYQLKS